jgi:uncharacterized membrane protein
MKKRYIYLAVLTVLILAFHLFIPNKKVMTAISETGLIIKQFIDRLCSVFPFSAAELLIVIGIIAVIIFIISTVISVIRAKRRLYSLYKRFTFALASLLTVYFMLCILLNASYHAESFQDKSGVFISKSTIDELYNVTRFFIDKLNETGAAVSRDKTGLFNVSVKEIIEESTLVYDGAEMLFPFLSMKDTRPKRVLFSRLMSRYNYTGFYFPFTGEANINTDVTPCMIPATITHEMAHQRGIASEQEANFVAVLACSVSGNVNYEYSGWLLGYINLGNALYKYDSERYYELARLLSDDVKKDIRANNDYWARYDTAEAKISEKVYDSFLKGNGQALGVESYGAVVDLLLAWYKGGGFR